MRDMRHHPLAGHHSVVPQDSATVTVYIMPSKSDCVFTALLYPEAFLPHCDTFLFSVFVLQLLFLQEHIFQLMKSDSYARFLRSNIYQDLLLARKKVSYTHSTRNVSFSLYSIDMNTFYYESIFLKKSDKIKKLAKINKNAQFFIEICSSVFFIFKIPKNIFLIYHIVIFNG